LEGTTDIDVSVVFVGWNVADYLVDAIASLSGDAAAPRVETIVVDNASTDDTVERVRQRFPDATVVANATNVGFARANNIGLARASGRFTFFLNPDTVVARGALARLVSTLDADPAAAVVGPKLIGSDGEPQPNARRLPTLRLALLDALYVHRVPRLGRWKRKRFVAPYDLDVSQPVEALSGAAMMLRTTVARELGGFGETFFHTGEDADLCFRVARSGWRILYDAAATVTHFGGRSSRQAEVPTLARAFVSMEIYFRRCRGTADAAAYRAIVQGVQIPLMIAVAVASSLLGRRDRHDVRARMWLLRQLVPWPTASSSPPLTITTPIP
jgi:GT2 family glycosyltransferase